MGVGCLCRAVHHCLELLGTRALAPNGKVIFVPYNADNVGVFDPVSNAFSVVDISATISSNGKYFGGMLKMRGMILSIMGWSI